MYITKIENFGKSKIQIYIDEEYKFWLYNKDLKKYLLKEDDILSQTQYEELYNLNLLRAKKQIINMLKRVDKTRFEVTCKLEHAGYSEDIISKALEYIDNYNYIDDERYARQLVRYKRDNKSKKEIQNILLIKGVSKEIIQQAILEGYGSEETAIKNAINKKTRNCSEFSQDQKRKLASNLYNKGYNLELIKKHIDI